MTGNQPVTTTRNNPSLRQEKILYPDPKPTTLHSKIPAEPYISIVVFWGMPCRLLNIKFVKPERGERGQAGVRWVSGGSARTHGMQNADPEPATLADLEIPTLNSLNS